VLAADARVLFEKSVAKFSPEVARPLWERWARYEYLFGDIASAQRLDGRFKETFPEGTSAAVTACASRSLT
jgi:cleavage stimulation factor subunit 3